MILVHGSFGLGTGAVGFGARDRPQVGSVAPPTGAAGSSAAPPPREPTAAVTPPENLPPGAVGEALAKLYQSLKSRP